MRKTFLLSLVGFTMFALASCQKESNEVGPDNSIANESVSTSALSAVVTSVFKDLDIEDRNYGSFGVLYTKSSDAETLFEKWKDGDMSVLQSIGLKKVSSIKADGHMTVTIDGLEPETEYYYCSFFESEDKDRRKIGGIDRFTTKEFKITLKNDGAVDINFYSSKVAATIADVEDADLKGVTFGILISTKENPGVKDGRVMELTSGVTRKQYTFKFEKLNVGTTYYCRPYVLLQSDSEYIYGETRTFSTKPADEMAVDMGLSVLWSKYLLGSEEIGGTGDYYRWGETEPISTKPYVQPEVDEISGNPDYDAAAKKLGGKWRLPTAAEIEELINNSSYKVLEGPDSQDEGLTNKLIVKSYSTGKEITIPQTGYYYSTTWGGINGTQTLSYSRPYGRFYLYSASQTISTYTDTYYQVKADKIDEFEAYSATHDVLYINDLLALGLIEQVTETITDKGATYWYPGYWLDEWYYVVNYPESYGNVNYKPLTSTVSGRYAYNILPVRDRD